MRQNHDRDTSSGDLPDSLQPLQPGERGSYALHFILNQTASLPIGRLGVIKLEPAAYVYTGSALGSGGLTARLRHHIRRSAKPRWHVDYLQPDMQLRAACIAGGGAALECDWSRRLAGLPGAFQPAPGFGASDCRRGCAAHLTGLRIETDPLKLACVLQLDCPGNPVIPVVFSQQDKPWLC